MGKFSTNRGWKWTRSSVGKSESRGDAQMKFIGNSVQCVCKRRWWRYRAALSHPPSHILPILPLTVNVAQFGASSYPSTSVKDNPVTTTLSDNCYMKIIYLIFFLLIRRWEEASWMYRVSPSPPAIVITGRGGQCNRRIFFILLNLRLFPDHNRLPN